ncbi:restriction endonuclease [Rhodococcus erythropolis]|nr:restriction endonuclease [Rhodococcus erythropolis]
MQYLQTPQEAEANAALRMRELGFTDARVTTGGADGGIDVRASAALAQVKWRGGLVGRPELQALFGARGSDFSKQLLFFAASGYSQHADEYADHSQIALFVYEPMGTLVPKNQHATRILHGGHHSVVGQSPRNEPPHIAAPASDPNQGFWPRVAWPFLKTHWRIIGAVVFTIGVFSSISSVISPQAGQTSADGVAALIMCLLGSPLFWWLYVTGRARKISEKQLSSGRDDTTTAGR